MPKPTIRAARAAERQAYEAACRVEKLREQLAATRQQLTSAVANTLRLYRASDVIWAELLGDDEHATVCDAPGQGWIVDGEFVPVD